MTLSDGAEISSTRFIIAWPNGLRLPKRLMLATQSRARTFCAVMEGQSVAQRQFPGLAVVVDAMALHHLRLHLELGVVGIQGVEHRQRVVAGDVCGGPDRIEGGQVGLGGEIDSSGTVRAADPRGGEGCRDRGRRFEHVASFQAAFPRMSLRQVRLGRRWRYQSKGISARRGRRASAMSGSGGVGHAAAVVADIGNVDDTPGQRDAMFGGGFPPGRQVGVGTGVAVRALSQRFIPPGKKRPVVLLSSVPAMMVRGKASRAGRSTGVTSVAPRPQGQSMLKSGMA